MSNTTLISRGKQSGAIISRLFLATVLLILSTACSSDRALLKPEDFTQAAEHITFETLNAQAPVTHQLVMKGMYVISSDGSPLELTDNDTGGGSLAIAVGTGSSGKASPLELIFTQPRSKVAMHFVRAAGVKQAVLTAFDSQGRVLRTASVPVAADVQQAFIGVDAGKNEIEQVTLSFMGASPQAFIDGIWVEPRQESFSDIKAVATLRSKDAERTAKLTAIGTLQRIPTSESSRTLQEAAQSDEDLYVRERAIMALGQIYDAKAIPTLVAIGEKAPNSAVRLAAYDTVWRLRKVFPMENPPRITLKATSQIRLGEEFDVEAQIVSPGYHQHGRARFGVGKGLTRVKTADPVVFMGELSANKPLVMRARFMVQTPGKFELPFTLRISENQVDATTYRVSFYIEVKEDGGYASTKPFPGWDKIIRHVIPSNQKGEGGGEQ